MMKPAAEQPAPDLRPNLTLVLLGFVSIALLSAATMPWPAAAASSALGALMISGADIDARTMLLPDIVTLGAALGGVFAAAVLDPAAPLLATATSAGRAALTALGVALLRWCYGALRGREGLGWGDVKLAAAIGAWLPLEAIPQCFALATAAALVAVGLGRGHGACRGSVKIPFGAYLCPALWMSVYAQLVAT